MAPIESNSRIVLGIDDKSKDGDLGAQRAQCRIREKRGAKLAPLKRLAQVCVSELVRMARRTRPRVARDVAACLLWRVDESQGGLRRRFDQVVVDGFLCVPVGELPRDDAVQAFHDPVRLATRLRSALK